MESSKFPSPQRKQGQSHLFRRTELSGRRLVGFKPELSSHQGKYLHLISLDNPYCNGSNLFHRLSLSPASFELRVWTPSRPTEQFRLNTMQLPTPQRDPFPNSDRIGEIPIPLRQEYPAWMHTAPNTKRMTQAHGFFLDLIAFSSELFRLGISLSRFIFNI